MKVEPTHREDGSVEFRVVLSKEELQQHPTGIFDKVEYCVTCGDRSTRGDIAANIEAAATCLTRTGNPSYSLRVGRCD